MVFPLSTIRYESVADSQIALRMRLRELAAARVGYGYRLLHIFLWCCFISTKFEHLMIFLIDGLSMIRSLDVCRS